MRNDRLAAGTGIAASSAGHLHHGSCSRHAMALEGCAIDSVTDRQHANCVTKKSLSAASYHALTKF
jgi:uncharacterized metal-binding protein